jgi:putative transposase
VVTPAAKRQAVAHLVASHEMSERRACRVIGCCRMTMRYEVVRQDDPVLRERLKDLAKARRRFGYRRLHVFLRREGHEVNHKRLFRRTAACAPSRWTQACHGHKGSDGVGAAA